MAWLFAGWRGSDENLAGRLDEVGVLGLDDLLGDEDVEAAFTDRDDLLSVGGVLAACEAGDGEEGKDGAFHGVRCGFGVEIKKAH